MENVFLLLYNSVLFKLINMNKLETLNKICVSTYL